MKFLVCFLLLLQIPTSTGHDRKVGSVAVRIVRRGKDTFMTPVIPPHFKLSLLSGPNVVADDIQACTVYGRMMSQDPPMEATVLRCGESEFGVEEVDFETND